MSRQARLQSDPPQSENGRPMNSGSSPGDLPGPSRGAGTAPRAVPIPDAVKMTDVGRVRNHNEDFVDFYVPTDPEMLERKGAIYLVADGMGGHQAGEVASQGAVETVIRQYYADPQSDIGGSLVRALRAANQRIQEQALADPSKTGMGTTMVAAVILGHKVYVANVGDSRAYLIGKTGLTQITEDHSWVGEQVRAGLLTPEQARRHPQRNLVTRALGTKPAVEVDLFEGQMAEGDRLLLCTDGLSGPVEDLEIDAIVREYPPQEAARLLIAKANERGGSDNITLLLVGGRRDEPAAPALVARPARSFPLIPALAGLAGLIVLLVAGLVLIPRLFKPMPTATPTSTPVASPSAEPTESPTVAATASEFVSPITLTPAGGAEGASAQTPVPTETLAPTVTTSPTPTGTPTRAAGATSAASQPGQFAAPVLLSPANNAEMRNKPTFTWQWPHGNLPSGYYFDLRIWSQQEDAAGGARRGAIEPTRFTEAAVDLALAPAIKQYGTGDYYWSVVVVRGSQNPIVAGQYAAKRKFRYVAAGEPGPEPTRALIPPVTVATPAPLPTVGKPD